MIPRSVSEGEANYRTVPFQSSPSLSRPSHCEPTLAKPNHTSLSTTRACTLSRCGGSVPYGKRKQASIQHRPYQHRPPQSNPYLINPLPASPFPHAEIPCLVVARGPSSRYGETKTDAPIQTAPDRASSDLTGTFQSLPPLTNPYLSPTDLPARCRRGGAEYLTGNQEGQRSDGADCTKPIQL